MKKLTPIPIEGRTHDSRKEPALEPLHRKVARVLVVDDDALLRTTIRISIEDRYDVEMAEDGKQGLEKFRGSKYDVVVTDLKMPNMGGMELLAEIRMMDPDVKVIVISGFLDSETEAALMRIGASLVLEKPMGIIELGNEIGKLLLH